MATTVRARCPGCRSVLRIPVRWLGQAVKCKKCGAVVRSRTPDTDTPLPNGAGTAESVPLDQTVPANPGEYGRPAAAGGEYPYPAAPVPPGYTYPAAPGYAPAAYGPPQYPYAPPPGYPYPVPHAAYGQPPGYPYPVPPGAYAPPPAYSYSAPAAPAPAPLYQNHNTGADLTPPTDTAPAPGPRRYRRKSGSSKFLWIGFCLVLTGGLVFGGIQAARWAERHKKTDQVAADQKSDGAAPATPAALKPGPFPRRLLFINLTKYMYLNPLTASQGGVDRSKPFAQRLQFDWRIPIDKDNNQLFILSDTTSDPAVPIKDVLQKTYERFFETSRDQDRIAIYFGGHMLEKGGKAFIAPIEGELDDPASLIPLEEFYAKLAACKATQKVVIWDVCRYNPQRGKQRPGSDPMSPALAAALAAAPAGIEVVTTCQPGENALEFNSLQTDPAPRSPVYAGSIFLESIRYVGEKNKTAKPPTPADPLPVADWAQAVGNRVNEMVTIPVVGLKQTVKAAGKPRGELVAPKEEAVAARFEMPVPPKGTSSVAIKKIESEFSVPPIKSDLNDGSLADLPYLEAVMKDYMPDVPVEEILKNKDNYKLRAATLDAFDTIRDLWAANPGDGGPGKLAGEVQAPITDEIKKQINDGLEFYAVGIARLELINITLDEVESLKAREPKRWQAHYEYARAVVKARLAYLNEFNKLMGNVRTESLPPLDRTLGQNMYRLASTEKMKSPKEIQDLAKESQASYARLITEHKGTPWALQAKRDRSFSLGLVWVPSSSAKDE